MGHQAIDLGVAPAAALVGKRAGVAEAREHQAGTNPGGRHLGGTVDFTLPTTGAIVLGTASGNSVGTANQILTSNGTAFATVGGNDWAGIDASRNILGLSTLGGYTANTCLSVNETVIHGMPNDIPIVDGDIAVLG